MNNGPWDIRSLSVNNKKINNLISCEHDLSLDLSLCIKEVIWHILEGVQLLNTMQG